MAKEQTNDPLVNLQEMRENCAVLCGGMRENFYVPTRTLGDRLPSQTGPP